MIATMTQNMNHLEKSIEIKRLRESNAELIAACRAAMATCGPADDWHGETQAFLRLIEKAVANAERPA
jgi:hypothetical protein